MVDPILAAFLAMLCWGFGDFLIQRSTRKIGDVETLFFIGIIGSVILLPFVLPDFDSLLIADNAALLIFLGIITFIVAIINFESLKKGKLSVVEVVLELELPITVLLGVVFFGEVLSWFHYVFLALILVGLILVAVPRIRIKHFASGLEKGLWLALVTAIGYGFVNYFTGVAAVTVSPLIAIWSAWLIFTIITFVFIFFRKKKGLLFVHMRKSWKIIIPMGILDTFGWVFYSIAILGTGLAIATGITESYPVIALLLGIFINKEKLSFQQVIGIVLVLVASIALGVMA